MTTYIPYCPSCGRKNDVEKFDDHQWYCYHCRVLFQYHTPEEDIEWLTNFVKNKRNQWRPTD